MTQVSILGSTGSIGQNTLRVIREYQEQFEVIALGCRCNVGLLAEQITEFSPRYVAVSDPDACKGDGVKSLVKRFPGTEFFLGGDAMVYLASCKTDICVSAIVGAAGLLPTLAAIRSSGRIALANKETLVMAGDLVLAEARVHGTEVIPVDSEHSAVFSLIRGCLHNDIRSIILTASGGSLRDRPLEQLDTVTPAEALNHPTWEMGSKITIDSATLFNKGLEVIEAHHLFGMPYERIRVLIHPESAVHSLIETVDGSLLAHIGAADMAHPIAAALTYPERKPNSFARFSLSEAGSLTFREVDHARYPALELCILAGTEGGTAPAVLNAANEYAVYAFLKGRIRFTDIFRTVEEVVSRHVSIAHPSIDTIFESDSWARESAERKIAEL
ncbi:MAG: 1-deoxy-D-xylulose-5-phosphate reductoisomerase [Spirochaetota bacterium]